MALCSRIGCSDNWCHRWLAEAQIGAFRGRTRFFDFKFMIIAAIIVILYLIALFAEIFDIFSDDGKFSELLGCFL